MKLKCVEVEVITREPGRLHFLFSVPSSQAGGSSARPSSLLIEQEYNRGYLQVFVSLSDFDYISNLAPKVHNILQCISHACVVRAVCF